MSGQIISFHAISDLLNEALQTFLFKDAAQVITDGLLEFDFDRVMLFARDPAHPHNFTGVSQSGEALIDGFEDLKFVLTDTLYLKKCAFSGDVYMAKGHTEGPGLLAQRLGDAYLPPEGYWAGAPLMVGQEIVGLLLLENLDKDGYIPDNAKAEINLIAQLTAGNLERARLHEEEAIEKSRLELLQKASSLLLDIIETGEDEFWLTMLTLATANYALGYNRAWVFLAGGRDNWLEGKMGVGENDTERARRAWKSDSATDLNFDHFIDQLRSGEINRTQLETLTKGLQINLANHEGNVFSQVLDTGTRKFVTEKKIDRIPQEFSDVFAPAPCAVLPLRAGRDILGLVIVDNKHDEKRFTPSNLDHLEMFMNIAGLAWQNYRQKQQKDALLSATHSIMGGTPVDDLKGTLVRLCSSAQEIFNADSVFIYPIQQLDGSTEYDMKNIGFVGDADHEKMVHPVVRPNGLTHHILTVGSALIENVHTHPLFTGDTSLFDGSFLERAKVRSLIGAPIRSIGSDRIVGVLYLNYANPRKYTNQHILYVEAFANLAGTAMHNYRITNEMRENRDAALSDRQLSQQELEKLQNILERTLAGGEETEVIELILNSLEQNMGESGYRVLLTLLKWKNKEDLFSEPEKVYHRHQLKQEVLIVEEESIISRFKSIDDCFYESGLLYVPMFLNTEFMGYFTVAGVLKSDTDKPLEIVKHFREAAALSLHSIRRQEILLAVLDTMREPKELEGTFKAIVEASKAITPDLSALTLWHYDSEREEITYQDSYGVDDANIPCSIQKEADSKNLLWHAMALPDSAWGDDLKKAEYSWINRSFVAQEKFLSVAVLPLLYDENEERIGVMFISYRTQHHFTDEERAFLEMLSNIAAMSLRESLRLRQLAEKTQRLEIAWETSNAIGEHLDLNVILDVVFSELVKASPNTRPCVVLYNEEDELLEFTQASFKYYPVDQEGEVYNQHFPISLHETAVACEVARLSLREGESRVLVVQDADEADSSFLPILPDTKAELCVSLVSQGQLLGVLVWESTEKNSFTPQDEKMARDMAINLSVAIARFKQTSDLNFNRSLTAAMAWAADLAHDFINDIGSIRTNAYLIQEQPDNPEKVKTFATKIVTSAANLARVGPWGNESQPILFDEFLPEWVDAAVEKRNQANRRGTGTGSLALPLDVKYDCNSPGIKITGILELFRKIFNHLVQNADKSMLASGERLIMICTQVADNDKLEIIFQDTGPGFDEEMRPLVFQQPFDATNPTGGHGLLLVRQFVETMGGKIRLVTKKESGIGATFSMLFDIYPNGNEEGVIYE